MSDTSTDGCYVFRLDEVDAAATVVVGGKAANLGELARIDGVRVPPGFCVTTAAYERARAEATELDALVGRLADIDGGDRPAIAELGAAIRRSIEALAVPDDVARAAAAALATFGPGQAFAVRSSATAEDQLGASFAGQHDSALGVVGEAAVLEQIRSCWASLFTDRAIAYRMRAGIDHRAARMAVVVQQLVTPDCSGVMFTADPTTGDRTVVAIEAVAGLGTGLVSGALAPRCFTVRRGAVVAEHAAPSPGGSASVELASTDVSAGRQSSVPRPRTPSPDGSSPADPSPGDPSPVELSAALLRDEQALRLAQLGRRIEAHFGRPQDIEWCRVGDDFVVVQARPITTLFPVPVAGDDAPHVYVSVGHQQMMTDAMRPLGWSFWQLLALRPMYQAGGRLFVDAAGELASPTRRAGVLMLGRSDPLIGDALQAIVDRGDLLPPADGDQPVACGPVVAESSAARGRVADAGSPVDGGPAADGGSPVDGGLSVEPESPAGGEPVEMPRRLPAGPPPGAAPVPGAVPVTGAVPAQIETDPTVVGELIAATETALAVLRRDIAGLSGVELLDFIAADVERWRGRLDPRGMQVIIAAIDAARWLDEHIEEWLGERHVADELTRSVPGNITSEMGLALLDVADVIRPYPEVVARLAEIATGAAGNDAVAGESVGGDAASDDRAPGRDDGDPGGGDSDRDDPVDGDAGVGDAAGDDPTDRDFLTGLRKLDGGVPAHEAIVAWLDRYGVRGVGEIDITRPRWGERPAMLAPLILGNVKNFAPGEAGRRVERGRQHAGSVEHELQRRLLALPDGDRKAAETGAAIRRLRTFAGYREFPKYGLVARTAEYRRALLEEADRLVAGGVLGERDDAYFLTFAELRAVVAGTSGVDGVPGADGRYPVDGELLRRRRDEFVEHQRLMPPRVMTSDGEVVVGSYRRDNLPAGALVGLGASAGMMEGRARVVHDVVTADLVPGDVLVTTYTDPSWTPLFLTAGALVTEVGGRTTHGAVVAREYGLPAVVGVERVTELIRDGQRVRVDGTNGVVEVLTES